jgi:hypothetical protein
MEQRMWANVVMFSFHEIYPKSFVNKFNFVNYITRNSPCIMHALQIFKCKYHLERTDQKGL